MFVQEVPKIQIICIRRQIHTGGFQLQHTAPQSVDMNEAHTRIIVYKST